MAEDQDVNAKPTESAEIEVQLRPATSWRTAVPGDQTPHLLATAGIVASACAGIAGAVFTMRTTHAQPRVAFAEMALALVAMLLVALRSYAWTRRTERAKLEALARQIEQAVRQVEQAKQDPDAAHRRAASRKKRSH